MYLAITQLQQRGPDVIGLFRLGKQVDILRRANDLVRSQGQPADQRIAGANGIENADRLRDLLTEAGYRCH